MSTRLLSFEKYFNSVRQNRLHFYILFLTLPWLVPLAGYLIWDNLYFSNGLVFITGSILNLLICLIAYNLNRIAARFSSKVYPEPHQSIYRVTLSFPLYAITNVSALYFLLHAYDSIGLFGYSLHFGQALWAGFIVLAGSLIGAGLTELAYTFMQWKMNQHELQQLEQKQLQTELEAVKQQVNPHFLFNCLNSLSVLISEAPATAEKFVDEMSKVYRYLLSVNGPERENSLVTLEAEIRFIKSYIYLLETRYEGGISINLQIADVYMAGQMAPLTLQTLIDNAIRHNIISPENPLHIHIKTTATGQLEIQNNLQKRVVRMPFSTAGLATLISRYKLLFNQAGTIQVKEDASCFTVLLPLIYT